MTDRELVFLSYDIESIVSNKKSKELNVHVNDFIKHIVKSVPNETEIESLQEFVDLIKNTIFSCVKKNSIDDNVYFAIGRYVGVLETLDIFLKEEIRKNRALTTVISEEAKSIPHINDIISNIAKQPGIRHGQLAENVGIERNTLTPIMDRLFKNQLITFSRPGKYKFYYLTKAGELYNKNYLANHNKFENINYLIEQLLIVLDNSSSPSEIVGKIMKAVYDGKHKFSGYKSKKEQILDNENSLDLIPKIIQEHPVNIHIKGLATPYFSNKAQVWQIIDNSKNSHHIIFDRVDFDEGIEKGGKDNEKHRILIKG